MWLQVVSVLFYYWYELNTCRKPLDSALFAAATGNEFLQCDGIYSSDLRYLIMYLLWNTVKYSMSCILFMYMHVKIALVALLLVYHVLDPEE